MKRKKSEIKVRIHGPSTEKVEVLKNGQASVMLDILEKQLGENRLSNLIEYAKEKYFIN